MWITYKLIPEGRHNHVANLAKPRSECLHVGQRNVGLKAVPFIDGYACGGFQQYKRFMLLGIGLKALKVFAPVVAAAIEMWRREGRGSIVYREDYLSLWRPTWAVFFSTHLSHNWRHRTCLGVALRHTCSPCTWAQSH